MKQRTDKEIFAEYAASAPRLDLAVYVDYAQRHRDAYSQTTRAIVSDMITYVNALTDAPVGSPAHQKRAVWGLIDRFKASIPGWHGVAGASDFYAEAFASQIALWVTHGQAAELRDPKTPPIEASQLLDAIPCAEAPRPRQPKKVPALICPACHAALTPVATAADVWGCAACRETWHLVPVRQKPVAVQPRAKEERPIVVDGLKTCTKCEKTYPVKDFLWGAGKTMRHVCYHCRKAQSRSTAAARRTQAA